MFHLRINYQLSPPRIIMKSELDKPKAIHLSLFPKRKKNKLGRSEIGLMSVQT